MNQLQNISDNKNLETNKNLQTEISNSSFFSSNNAPNLFQQKLIIKNLLKKEFGEEHLIYPKGLNIY